MPDSMNAKVLVPMPHFNEHVSRAPDGYVRKTVTCRISGQVVFEAEVGNGPGERYYAHYRETALRSHLETCTDDPA